MNTLTTHFSTLLGQPLTPRVLQSQNRAFRGTGGRSQENRGYGFRPAFLDTETGVTYLSASGRVGHFQSIEEIVAFVAEHLPNQASQIEDKDHD